MIGIYKLTNKLTNNTNGSIYIGKSKNIFSRINQHFYLLNNNCHHNNKIQNDYNSSKGISDFSFEVLELCDESLLEERERHYIDLLDSVTHGYNIASNEKCDTLGKLDIKLTSYVKSVFRKLHNSTACKFVVLNEEEATHLIKMFGDLEMPRNKTEIFIIPNELYQFKKPPYIFLYEDFIIE